MPALSKTTPALSSLSDTYLSGAIEKHKDRVSFTPEELGELKHLVKTIAGQSVAGPTIVQAKAGSQPLNTSKRKASAASKKGSGHRRPSVSQISMVLSIPLVYWYSCYPFRLHQQSLPSERVQGKQLKIW